MSVHTGKIRLILHKLDEENDFEENYDFRQYIYNGFITNVSKFEESDMIEYELNEVGLYALKDQLKEILSKYKEGAVIEILADMIIEWTPGSYEYPNEWDSKSWLDNVKERELNLEQIERFFPIGTIND